ncbi:MAG: hypothetical protein LBQ75_04150 [Zoogloeaceae bacterium]|jgi:hypothetical protein|nr:hypothetical protein [Zoogloeaceae bacterium]
MGIRLHPCTKYEMEFGDGSFNNRYYDLLEDMEREGICVCPPADDVHSDVEVYAEEFQKYIQLKKKALADGQTKIGEDIDLAEAIEDLQYIFEGADKRDGFVHMAIY